MPRTVLAVPRSPEDVEADEPPEAVTVVPDLAVLWPQVAPRAERALARLGCGVSDREDILQEVALRLIVQPVPCQDAADLAPWVCTVARRLYIDLLRRQDRRGCEALDVVSQRPDRCDVPRVVEQRLALNAIRAALQRLSPQQLQILLDDGGAPLSAAVKMQRLRLRDRLRKSAGGLIVAALLLSGACAAPHHQARPNAATMRRPDGSDKELSSAAG